MDIFSWDSLIAINWPYAHENGAWVPLPAPATGNEYLPRWASWFQAVELRERMADRDSKDYLRPGPAGWRCEGTCLLRELNGEGFERSLDMVWDQNGQPVYYEIRVSDAWVKTGRRDRHGKISFQHGQCRDRYHRDIYTLPGSVEIKLAWKVMGPDDVRERFYIMSDVTLPGRDEPADVGLVAMHLGQKGKTHRKWVWSTFEHVDNVHDAARHDAGARAPLFTDPACTDCCANVRLLEGHTPRRSQLTRITPIDPDTAQLNQEVRRHLAGLGSVWQHYELIGTQYVSLTGASRQGTPPDLRNTIIEPFMVPHTPCMREKPEQTRSDCIGCHEKAASGDFSYVPDQFYPATEASSSRN